jgi:hypothetical protein
LKDPHAEAGERALETFASSRADATAAPMLLAYHRSLSLHVVERITIMIVRPPSSYASDRAIVVGFEAKPRWDPASEPLPVRSALIVAKRRMGLLASP